MNAEGRLSFIIRLHRFPCLDARVAGAGVDNELQAEHGAFAGAAGEFAGRHLDGDRVLIVEYEARCVAVDAVDGGFHGM